MCHHCGKKSRRAVCKDCIKNTSKPCPRCGKHTPSITCEDKPTKSPYCLSCGNSIKASKSRGGYTCKSCGERFTKNGQHRVCEKCLAIKVECPQCGNAMSKYKVSGELKKYCSTPCVVKSMSFEKLSERSKKRNATLWHGYERKTSANKAARKTRQYKEWRESVYERDNYTCQECGKRGGKLHPHHIKEFAKFPELRYVVNNGQTLCENCHKLKHSHTFTGRVKRALFQ